VAGMTQSLEVPITHTHENSSIATSSTPDAPDLDFVLQAVVGMVHDTGIEIGITLCVGGVIVSGQLIPGKRYFAGIADEAFRATGPADQAGFRNCWSEYLGDFGKFFYEPAPEKEQSDNGDEEIVKRLLYSSICVMPSSFTTPEILYL
jgi:hypothetical protein